MKPTSNPRIRAALPPYNLYGLFHKQIRITYMFLVTNAFHTRLLWLNHESRHKQQRDPHGNTCKVGVANIGLPLHRHRIVQFQVSFIYVHSFILVLPFDPKCRPFLKVIIRTVIQVPKSYSLTLLLIRFPYNLFTLSRLLNELCDCNQ